MENTYWNRYFLMINDLANRMMGNGYQYQNFAVLIKEEEEGRSFNSQMTKYFHIADEWLAELNCSDSMMVLDEIDGYEMVMGMDGKELKKEYVRICLEESGHLKLEFSDVKN